MFALAAQIPDRSARASPADPFKNPSMDAGATPAEEPVTTSVPPPLPKAPASMPFRLAPPVKLEEISTETPSSLPPPKPSIISSAERVLVKEPEIRAVAASAIPAKARRALAIADATSPVKLSRTVRVAPLTASTEVAADSENLSKTGSVPVKEPSIVKLSKASSPSNPIAQDALLPAKDERMDTVFKDVHPSASLSAVMEAPADAPAPKLPCISRDVREDISEKALVALALAPLKLPVMDARSTSPPNAKLSREAPAPVSEFSITQEVTPETPERAWRKVAFAPVNDERMATEPMVASWAAKVADAPVPVKDPSISKEPRVEAANALVALIPASRKELFIFTLAKEAPFRMEGAEGEVLTAA